MLRTLFVFAIIIPGIYMALRSRFAGLLLYLWFGLFRPQEFTWVDFSNLHLSLVVGIIFVVPCLLSGVGPNLTHPLSIAGVLFLFSAVMAQFNAVDPSIGWYWIDFMARLLAVCLLCVTLVNSRERFLAVLAVIAVSFGFHTAKAGLYSLIHGGSRFSEGLAGAFSDNNGYALGMVMVLWLLVGTGQNAGRVWLRWGLYTAAVLTAFATVATFSRGGFIALSASTIMYVLLQRRRGLAVIGLVLLLLALPFLPTPEGYTDRLQTIQTYEEVDETSALSRLHFWRVAVNMVADNPIGVGLFNYELAYDRYDPLDGKYGHRRSVHSSFFQVLAETGYLGFSIYAFMMFYSVVLVLKIRRRARGPGLDAGSRRFLETSAGALGASIVGFMAGGAFIALALNDLTWLLFALLASLDRLSLQMCAQAVTATDPSKDTAAAVLRAGFPAGLAAPSRLIPGRALA